MRLRRFLSAAVVMASVALSGVAFADAQGFVEREQQKIAQLLKQPSTSDRDAKITNALSAVFDYDDMTQRSFGKHWEEFTPAQRTEVKTLLRQLIEKNYKKNLLKTLDYEVVYKGVRDGAGESRIRTEAKSKVKPREPAVQVDYVVKPEGDGYRVVDIITEGSSLTRNYYSQFHKMLTTQGQGYGHVVNKLKEKIAKHE